MEAIKAINLGLRFVLELCILASVGYFGFHNFRGILVKLVLGIGAPVLIAIVWATFGAPGAARPLPGAWRFGLEILLYAIAAAALYASGRTTLAWVFVVVAVLNRVLMYVWGQ